MRIIGLTGGIAGGKSTVSRYLASKGIQIIDADKISHEICDAGSECCKLIRNKFGDSVFDGEVLNRRKLAEIVFSDKSKLCLLESITHPLIIEETKKRLMKCGDIAVIDAPLLFAAGMDKLCTEIWSVSADEDVRIKRIMLRDGIDENAAKKRIQNQMPQEIINKLSNIVLYNNGSEKELLEKVEKALNG